MTTDTATQDSAAPAATKKPIDKAVCICKKVRTNEFLTKVKAHKAYTIEEAREVTGANTGCGACYEYAESLLAQVRAEVGIT